MPFKAHTLAFGGTLLCCVFSGQCFHHASELRDQCWSAWNVFLNRLLVCFMPSLDCLDLSWNQQETFPHSWTFVQICYSKWNPICLIGKCLLQIWHTNPTWLSHETWTIKVSHDQLFGHLNNLEMAIMTSTFVKHQNDMPCGTEHTLIWTDPKTWLPSVNKCPKS